MQYYNLHNSSVRTVGLGVAGPGGGPGGAEGGAGLGLEDLDHTI